MKRVAIYMRVSTAHQVKEGDSLSAQREGLLAYIKAHEDMILVGEYVDDGISGTKLERDELQRLLDDVRARKIDLILVTKLDRWFRSIKHYVNTQEVLDRNGVGWTAIWETIYDSTTPQGRLIINQMMSIAQFEAENTGQRIRQVFDYKIKAGEFISGNAPIGLKIANKRLIRGDNADVILSAFQHYADTMNLNDTQRYLASLGIVRTRHTVKDILSNPIYKGVYRGIKDFCPAIVPEELWEDVQRKLVINVKSSAKRVYIFQGLIKCGVCGRRLGGFTVRCHGKIYSRYRCNKLCTNKETLSERKVERYMISNLEPLVVEEIRIAESAEKKKDNRAKVARIKKRISRLKELYLNGLISLEEYRGDYSELEKELQELSTEEEKPKRDISALIELKGKAVSDIYAAFSPEEKRLFWRSIVKEIKVGERRKLQVFFVQ